MAVVLMLFIANLLHQSVHPHRRHRLRPRRRLSSPLAPRATSRPVACERTAVVDPRRVHRAVCRKKCLSKLGGHERVDRLTLPTRAGSWLLMFFLVVTFDVVISVLTIGYVSLSLSVIRLPLCLHRHHLAVPVAPYFTACTAVIYRPTMREHTVFSMEPKEDSVSHSGS